MTDRESSGVAPRVAVCVVTFNSAPLIPDLVDSLPAGMAGIANSSSSFASFSFTNALLIASHFIAKRKIGHGDYQLCNRALLLFKRQGLS